MYFFERGSETVKTNLKTKVLLPSSFAGYFLERLLPAIHLQRPNAEGDVRNDEQTLVGEGGRSAAQRL